ncbi:hypothetical protein MALL_0844 [Mycoplasmopsis alligatoris A21JP2]|uniref:Uncharacterized protein n=1 Tax=Mycoplasmopsis alligatoris A21JP2 TaxID=747682 RepID=D4XWA7_9BACT|nr:hypothetical protein MALL_0844 [Mycoplasmopsis alligatoris A21JP2]
MPPNHQGIGGPAPHEMYYFHPVAILQYNRGIILFAHYLVIYAYGDMPFVIALFLQ